MLKRVIAACMLSSLLTPLAAAQLQTKVIPVTSCWDSPDWNMCYHLSGRDGNDA
jgi:hypothetical protein